MKKIILLTFLLIRFLNFAQNNPDRFADGLKTPTFISDTKTTAELNSYTFGSDDRVLAFDETLNRWVRWNGASWINAFNDLNTIAGSGLIYNGSELRLDGTVSQNAYLSLSGGSFVVSKVGEDGGLLSVNNNINSEINGFGSVEFGTANATGFLKNGFRGFTDKFEFVSETGKGIEYDTDYGSTFTARSLIDKSYADANYLSSIGDITLADNNVLNIGDNSTIGASGGSKLYSDGMITYLDVESGAFKIRDNIGNTNILTTLRESGDLIIEKGDVRLKDNQYYQSSSDILSWGGNATTGVRLGTINDVSHVGELDFRKYAGANNNFSSLITQTESASKWGLDFLVGESASTTKASLSAMFITPTADIGVGTKTPTEKLDVNGNVKATSFIGNGSTLTGVNDFTGGTIIVPNAVASNQPPTLSQMNAAISASGGSGGTTSTINQNRFVCTVNNSPTISESVGIISITNYTDVASVGSIAVFNGSNLTVTASSKDIEIKAQIHTIGEESIDRQFYFRDVNDPINVEFGNGVVTNAVSSYGTYGFNSSNRLATAVVRAGTAVVLNLIHQSSIGKQKVKAGSFIDVKEIN